MAAELRAAFHRGSGGLESRPHQLSAVSSALAAVDEKRRGHLLFQHAPGSGKSLTIALLAQQLLLRRRFRCIVVVSDRRQLDGWRAADPDALRVATVAWCASRRAIYELCQQQYSKYNEQLSCRACKGVGNSFPRERVCLNVHFR